MDVHVILVVRWCGISIGCACDTIDCVNPDAAYHPRQHWLVVWWVQRPMDYSGGSVCEIAATFTFSFFFIDAKITSCFILK